VLFHGFTNAPEQWAEFAADLYARGHTVVVPRLPGHGYADRRGEALARVTAADYLATASAAADIAAGCGERVAFAGLSLGGALALRLAQTRSESARVVPIVPLFGVFEFGPRASGTLAAILSVAPNVSVPWDPSGNPRSTPPHAYPRFPTRGLAVAMRLGLDAYRDAARLVPAGHTTFLLNAHEPAISNPLARAVARRLNAGRSGAADTVVLEDLPKNHDIIDPTNPNERIAEVYPRVRALVEG
jgi:carboxylesterase